MEKKIRRKLLLVDDEDNNLSFMARCLHGDDYIVKKCLNPIEALELVKSEKFDVILSDHKMPDMSGIDFLQKAGEIQPDSMKIIVTAYSDTDLLIDAINKAKVYRYIKKPYTPSELKLTVASALDYLRLTEDNANLIGDLKDLFSGTIKAIVEALDAKDPFTLGRSRRVTFYSLKIAHKLGLSSYLMGKLELAGLLHDIGMIGVSDEILQKTEKLTAEEYEEIKNHVQHGIRILKDIDQLNGIMDIIKHHHEYYDGTGYPDGLKGEEIPLLSRIIAVTDAYDSMVSNRVYRVSSTSEEAIARIKSAAGKQFDPKIIAVFEELLPEIVEEIKIFDTKSDDALYKNSEE